MGKLQDLWNQWKSTTGDKKEIEYEIHKIESWMIEKGFRKELTNFAKYKNMKPSKRKMGVKERMATFTIPKGAKIGNQRCEACRYNYAPYCDPKDPHGHYARF